MVANTLSGLSENFFSGGAHHFKFFLMLLNVRFVGVMHKDALPMPSWCTTQIKRWRGKTCRQYAPPPIIGDCLSKRLLYVQFVLLLLWSVRFI